MSNNAYEAQELPELTDKQYKYVLARKSGMNKSDSYRQAYDADDMPPEQVWVRASEVDSNSKVAVWMEAIKLEQINGAKYQLQQAMEEAEELRQIAIKSGNIGAAVNAHGTKCKLAGLFIDRVRDVTPKDDMDALQLIEQLLGKEIAEEAARRLGIEIEATKH